MFYYNITIHEIERTSLHFEGTTVRFNLGYGQYESSVVILESLLLASGIQSEVCSKFKALTPLLDFYSALIACAKLLYCVNSARLNAMLHSHG